MISSISFLPIVFFCFDFGRMRCADQRMNFVDEQNGVRTFLQFLQDRLQALFEVAAILGACEQRAHIERIHLRIRQNVRHFAARNAPRETFGNRGLTHTGLTDQQRIILATAAQHLHDALDFRLAPDQRIDATVFRHLVQVLRELGERGFLLRGGFVGLGIRVARFRGVRAAGLRNAMRDEIHHIQTRHALLLQVVHRMRILLAEDRHQHVRAGHFLLAIRGGLNMHDGTLDHTLETQRGLRVDVVRAGHGRRVVMNEVAQVLAQILDIGRACTQHLGRRWVIQQSQ